MKNSFAKILKIIALTLFFSLIGGKLIHYKYMISVRSNIQIVKDVPKKVSKSLYLRIGRWSRNLRASSFYNFSKKKESNVLRIGAFGDSYTFGTEVNSGHDFPHHLQRIIEERENIKVEVLNFGSGWHSFQQSYLIWRELGVQYDLDIVLLGPGSFQEDRNTMFNHTYDRKPSFIHSLFILEDGKIKEVEIEGNTLEEKIENYYSFIPLWNVLKYDANAPAFVRAFYPIGSIVRNPFVVKRDLKELYFEMIKEISKNSKVFIKERYLHRLEGIERLDNVFISKTKFRKIFPQWRLKHHSSYGNYILALEYYEEIFKKEGNHFKYNLKNLENEKKSIKFEKSIELNKISNMDVIAEDKILGKFYSVNAKDYYSLDFTKLKKQKNIKSFISIKEEDDTLLDTFLIPISEKISAGDVLKIKVGDSIYKKKLQFIDSKLPIAYINMKIEKDFRFNNTSISAFKALIGDENKPLEIWKNDKRILEYNSNVFNEEFSEALNGWVFIPGPNDFVDIRSLKNKTIKLKVNDDIIVDLAKVEAL